MKVSIVYDRVNKWGGAERVLLALHDMFPDAPLYTSVYNSDRAKWALVFPKVFTSFLQRFPFAKDKHEFYPLLMPIAFEQFNFDQYDLVISVTSEAAKGIITKPPTKHICYLLTPTRYLWSHYNEYLQGETLQVVTRPLINYLKRWDKIAAARPDKIIAISTEVQKRTKKYYGRDSVVIFPPVEGLKTDEKNKTSDVPKDYFLVVSRLVPYKKVDLVVEAFNELELPLVVVGTGSQEERLKYMAKSNIYFTGYVEEEDLSFYYQNCKALIFPQNEDFGLTAVEAQTFGKPVIAYKSGGALDTIIEGKTGLFFDKQEKNALIKTLNSFHEYKFSVKIIIENAKRFSKERFKKEFLKAIKNI